MDDAMLRAQVEAGYVPLREYVEARMPGPVVRLGSADINAAYRLQKYGRLCELEPGRFAQPGGYVTSSATSMRKLARLGVCRFDKLGDAVFIRPLTAVEKGKYK